MTSYDLLIRGNVVKPDGVLPDSWVAVRGETIAAVGSGAEPPAVSRYDAGQAFVMPGLIDGQTHAGSQFGFPGLEPTTRSAVAGGITTIVDMPYDEPRPVDAVDVLDEKVGVINTRTYCNVALYATVSSTPNIDDVRALVDAGVAAFKISSFENHPTRFPRITNEHAFALLSALADTDVPTGLHNEDQEIIKAQIARFETQGRTRPEDHDPSRPEVAEVLATASFLELGAATGAHVHIVHISTPRGFELVQRYRDEGFRATAEMCVHYLHFDAATDMPRLGGLLKVNPPIRGNVRKELWDEMLTGGVEFVSSDHSAWPLARKKADSIFKVAAGIPGLETLVPAFFTGASAHVEDPASFTARYLSERPARFFGLWPRKGAIAPGADADITILEPQAFTFAAANALDGLGWSPFDGETFKVKPSATFVRGQQVWNGQAIVASPGVGRYEKRIAA
ncbi:amidohydrolase family protein [Methylocella sp. CPCC 101449]|uniref:dihydroorotase n=1 Tax=Methylocella sp. CPCC 101449 TaxID=2987531 RepID=UPI00288D9DE4|nr:amidohydrolase family protein [Methylocella sp. CPCC 101449]MDT2022403.1 amidohydrolase family protein [Methylocella sp. CPCC 101449]